ncbi:MAG: LPS assembly lipoprotein LptE [Pseudomonadota bacterium]
MGIHFTFKCFRRVFLGVFAGVLVSGCGYHLRGAADLPLEVDKVYVNNASKHLVKGFKDALKASGGRLASKPQEADLVLNIMDEELERRYISLSATGKANEFEYNYEIYYEWNTPKGEAVLPQQFYAISRDYFNDQLDIIGKTNEEAVLRKEIYRQAAQGILRQSGLALKHSRLDAQ